ncbi:hypothetical protein VKX94_02130 [Lactobacillus helveticus]|uniref:Uncharacterized protein n=1 Tax=Lactobacillus helveticus CIRM-BIA 951 TaxID=1226334 RepID=U6F346_LACHE|nr:hypothetical protein [Lactobacillus helveticus]MDY0990922.1 hypothetical protein [Lactobacillus helveticus]MDY1001579.1 hypothetical protein [Lactobacillus helveticus]MEB2873443.1 hypothetical protein [Lactobacillus helveticus]CDI58577.1 Protein of unknown function [Lactobacillus helveticus CIRM-BIA 951]
MKFYLSSAKECEPYYDLKNNNLMQKYLREIKKEAGVEVTFEKATTFGSYQHIVIDIPSMKALVQIMKAIDEDLVIEQEFIDEDNKYPIICIYDDYLE